MSKDDVKRIVIEIQDILPEYTKDKSITRGLLGKDNERSKQHKRKLKHQFGNPPHHLKKNLIFQE